jgi:transcriptional regulator, ArsR family
MEMKKTVNCLAALAQETRLAIFRLLVQAGPEGLCVSDIRARLRVAPATLSFHLAQLAHARLVDTRQPGPLHLLFRRLRGHERHRRLPHRELLRRPALSAGESPAQKNHNRLIDHVRPM